METTGGSGDLAIQPNHPGNNWRGQLTRDFYLFICYQDRNKNRKDNK